LFLDEAKFIIKWREKFDFKFLCWLRFKTREI